MDQATFSAEDRQRFQVLKDEIRQLLPRARPDSAAIHEVARRFVEVRDRGLYRLDDQVDCEGWMERAFRVGRRQAQKYLVIGDHLSAAEVAGRQVGVEGMYQVGQEERAALRTVLFDLAEEEGMTEGGLGQGRRAAQELAQRGLIEAAKAVCIRQARRRAQRDQAEAEGRRRRKAERSAVEAVREVLMKQRLRLERLAARGVQVTAAEHAALAEELARLQGIVAGLQDVSIDSDPEEAAADIEAADIETADPAEEAAADIEAADPAEEAAADPEAADPEAADPAEEAAADPEAADLDPAPPAPPSPQPPSATAPAPPEMAPFLPLLQALPAHLGPREDLPQLLSHLIQGHPLRDVLPPIRRALRRAGPHPLADQLLAGLSQPDWESRARFALRCLVAPGPDKVQVWLILLANHPLPAPAKREVLWWWSGAQVPVPPPDQRH